MRRSSMPRHRRWTKRVMSKCSAAISSGAGSSSRCRRAPPLLRSSSPRGRLVVEDAHRYEIVLEGGALSSFHAYRSAPAIRCLATLFDGVIRDEARHVGFGVHYLRNVVREMTEDEREATADYAFTIVMAFAETRRESLKSSASILAERASPSKPSSATPRRRLRAERRAPTGHATASLTSSFPCFAASAC